MNFKLNFYCRTSRYEEIPETEDESSEYPVVDSIDPEAVI